MHIEPAADAFAERYARREPQVVWTTLVADLETPVSAFLKVAGSVGLLALVPTPRLAALVQSAPTAGQAGRFLSAHELDTLRSVTGRLLPGPPEDPDPGAIEAGAAEAIDMLLGAFTFDPPLIHAGGPFSNRERENLREKAPCPGAAARTRIWILSRSLEHLLHRLGRRLAPIGREAATKRR